MDLMGFLSDHMGHFSLYDLPNLVFAVLLAVLLGYLLGRFGGKVRGAELRALALWAGSAALAAAIVRSQLPLAVVLVALVLLVRSNQDGSRDRALQFGALVLGLGCGSGAALVTLVAAVPYILVVRWAFKSKD
ncbi:MAG: hypothetical protein IPL52_00980 [Flavobacteriales bacterium]|nr:hypothetical protein [Flavobacteriales bacterium]